MDYGPAQRLSLKIIEYLSFLELLLFFSSSFHIKKKKQQTHTHTKLFMQTQRSHAIGQAQDQKKWGIILGTLGRQGNVQILERLKKAM